MAAGRPKNTIKDSNRRKVRNPNGRIIDFEGPQYNKLIKSGYILNNDKLVKDPQFTNIENDVKQKQNKGRPKKYTVVATVDKVKNPDTGRMIKTNTYKFKQLTNKYLYDAVKNEFTKEVFDSKTKEKILINSDKSRGRLQKGYIHDKENDKLIKPSKKCEKAFGNSFATFELKIINKDDPLIQMHNLNNRITILLRRKLKKLNGIKFNIAMEIEFFKTTDDKEVIQSFHTIAKIQELLSSDGIPNSIENQNEDIKRKIDRFTVNGSGWAIRRILKHT